MAYYTRRIIEEAFYLVNPKDFSEMKKDFLICREESNKCLPSDCNEECENHFKHHIKFPKTWENLYLLYNRELKEQKWTWKGLIFEPREAKTWPLPLVKDFRFKNF